MSKFSFPSFPQELLLVTAALTLLWVIGCDVPARPPLDPVAKSSLSTSDSDLADSSEPKDLESPAKPFGGRWETWDAHFVRGQHVGYSHIMAEPVDQTSGADVKYTMEGQLKIRRGVSTVIQRFSQTSTETSRGQLLAFDGATHVGPALTQYNGRMDRGNLVIETLRGTNRSTRQIPWQPTFRGLVAVEQSLRRKPMQVGEKRTLQMLLPAKYEMATVQLHCNGKASVPLLENEQRTLLEIDSQVSVGGMIIESMMWTDESGNILRTYSPAIQMIAYRTQQATAKGDFGAA
ncbi:MAG: hypothetical protein MI861_17495, partial [Pirellulales bacterium]|nr:hypothetical protein [Pirellulales bacterium]